MAVANAHDCAAVAMHFTGRAVSGSSAAAVRVVGLLAGKEGRKMQILASGGAAAVIFAATWRFLGEQKLLPSRDKLFVVDKSLPADDRSVPRRYPLPPKRPAHLFAMDAQQAALRKADGQMEEDDFGPAKAVHPDNSAPAVAARSVAAAILGAELEGVCPAIPVDPRGVQFLSSPGAFFDYLIESVARAEHRIVMSALYIGAGAHSCRLVNALAKAVATKPSLSVLVLLDHGRMCASSKQLATLVPLLEAIDAREGAVRTARDCLNQYRDSDSRHSAVADPLGRMPGAPTTKTGRARISLLQMPTSAGRVLKPFGRAREMVGVLHTKIFIFDDDVMLSGANLSDDYFIDRIDRYGVFADAPRLARWYDALAQAMARISHPVTCVSTGRALSAAKLSTRQQRIVAGAHEFKKSGAALWPNRSGRDPNADNKGFREECRREIGWFVDWVRAERLAEEAKGFSITSPGVAALAAGALASGETEANADSVSTYVFPTLQFGRIGIHHDTAVMERVLSFAARPGGHSLSLRSGAAAKRRVVDDAVAPAAADAAKVHTLTVIASPYLNLLPDYVDVLLAHAGRRHRYDVITSGLGSNGWKKSSGFMSLVPALYQQLQRSFFWLVRERGCGRSVGISEFEEPGMTLHAKGVWLGIERETPAGAVQIDAVSDVAVPTDEKKRAGGESKNSKADEPTESPLSPIAQSSVASISSVVGRDSARSMMRPYATCIGSSNYGCRSAHKDVESEVVLVTVDPRLQKALGDELGRLSRESGTVTDERFVGDGGGRFQPVLSLIASMGTAYM